MMNTILPPVKLEACTVHITYDQAAELFRKSSRRNQYSNTSWLLMKLCQDECKHGISTKVLKETKLCKPRKPMTFACSLNLL